MERAIFCRLRDTVACTFAEVVCICEAVRNVDVPGFVMLLDRSEPFSETGLAGVDLLVRRRSNKLQHTNLDARFMTDSRKSGSDISKPSWPRSFMNFEASSLVQARWASSKITTRSVGIASFPTYSSRKWWMF